MAKFIGEYRAKVDDKGRLIFPAAFKSVLGDGSDQRLVVKRSLYSPCLEMYTYGQWEEDSEQLRSRLNLFNRRHADFWREYMRDTAVVEPDSKLGRLMIPKAMLEGVGITKDVVFSGSNFMIEVWDKDKFDAGKMTGDEFASLAEEILG